MSMRWPLKSTRGFSATPRRGFNRSRALQAPSRPVARRIVKRAGPLQTAFFTDGNLLSAGTIPFIFAGAAVRQGDNNRIIFSDANWISGPSSSRAKCFIRKLTYTAWLTSNPGASDLGFHAYFNFALLAGRPDDITDDVLTPRAFPWGEQSSLIAYQDSSRRTVRMRQRRRFTMFIPGTYQNATGEEILLSNLVGLQRTTRVLSVTLRNLWIEQNQQVRVLFSHIKEGISLDPINQSGSITGWDNVLVQYATY